MCPRLLASIKLSATHFHFTVLCREVVTHLHSSKQFSTAATFVCDGRLQSGTLNNNIFKFRIELVIVLTPFVQRSRDWQINPSLHGEMFSQVQWQRDNSTMGITIVIIKFWQQFEVSLSRWKSGAWRRIAPLWPTFNCISVSVIIGNYQPAADYLEEEDWSPRLGTPSHGTLCIVLPILPIILIVTMCDVGMIHARPGHNGNYVS